jgi:hypothetical protein
MPIRIKDMNPEERESVGMAAAWARQSIAFAFSVRNSATTKSLNDRETAILAKQEADHLTDDLWNEVARDCDTVPEGIIRYAEKVFGWCHKHMNRDG